LSSLALSAIPFVGLIELVKIFVGHNGLVGFIRLGLVSLICFGLIKLVELIGLFGPSGIISLIGYNGLVGFIGLGLIGFIGLVLVSLVGLIGHISLVGPISFNGISGLIDQISLVSLSGISGISGLIGQISLVVLSASSNHWLIGLIGVIGFGLIGLSASSASAASLARQRISLGGLIGLLSHWLFCHRLATFLNTGTTNHGGSSMQHHTKLSQCNLALTKLPTRQYLIIAPPHCFMCICS
jgi:hypothetical protein